jgi:hypothetical protein
MVRRVWLPLVTNLGWGLFLLLALPQITYPLRPTLLIVPDLGYLIAASAGIALTWALVRTVLVYSTLRRPPVTQPAPAAQPESALAPTGS